MFGEACLDDAHAFFFFKKAYEVADGWMYVVEGRSCAPFRTWFMTVMIVMYILDDDDDLRNQADVFSFIYRIYGQWPTPLHPQAPSRLT